MRRAVTTTSRYTGPASAPTRGYSSVPMRDALVNAHRLATHVLTGEKPKFRVLVGDSPSAQAHNARTAREYEAYLAQCAATREAAKELATEVAKDQAKKFAAAVALAVAALVKAILEADNDLDEVMAEADAEKERLAKEIAALEDDKDVQAAKLEELEKQYVTWTDWWNNTTGARKQDCQLAIVALTKKQEQLAYQLNVKVKALAEVEAIRDQRARDRDSIILALD